MSIFSAISDTFYGKKEPSIFERIAQTANPRPAQETNLAEQNAQQEGPWDTIVNLGKSVVNATMPGLPGIISGVQQSVQTKSLQPFISAAKKNAGEFARENLLTKEDIANLQKGEINDKLNTKLLGIAGLTLPVKEIGRKNFISIDSFRRYFNTKTNTYIPERAKLHEQILNNFLDSKPKSENPVVTFITGTTGSGKSTYSKTVFEQQHPNVLVVDSDLIKVPLGGKVPYFHEESSQLAEELYKRAVNAKKDIVFLGNLKDTPKYQNMLALAREKGYTIQGRSVEPPSVKDWFSRVVGRNLKGDQIVKVKDAWATLDSYSKGLDLLNKYDPNTKIIESKGGLFADKVGGSSFGRQISAVGRGSNVGERVGTTGRQALLEQGTSGFSKQRGFISSAKEVIPEANKIAGQYVPRETDTLAIKAKNLIKEDINTAENLALTGSDDKAVATASELLKHYGAEAKKATSETIKNALYDKAAQVANTIAPKLTESGRTVQAASILGRLTPEGQVRFAAGLISKYNETVPIAKKIPGISGEQARNIVNEMKAINTMADGTEKAMRFQKLQNYITDLVPTPLFKKIVAVWKAGLLTGIKTSGINIFANVSHAGTEVAKDIPSTMVDKITSIFTGERAVTTNIKGVVTGAKEGVNKGLRYFTTGFDERNIGTKLDYTRVNFGKGKLAKGLQAYTDTVFHLMGSEDQPFYYAAKLRSLYEQAKVGAINKGLKGQEAQKFIDNLMQNPTEQMIKYATTDAETAVFQNRTVLGEAARSIQKVGGGAGEVVVPFGRTPSAVATQILNYSPVGIAKTIFENVGKGKFDQRLFSQGIGRGLTGTAVLALGAELYKKGMVTTSRPTGEKEQKLWELEGKQPNSIKIGDKWRQVQVLGPAGNLLLMGGSFQKAFNNSGSPSEAMAQGLADASQSFTQQTFLTGISNFIDAISDPARSASSVAGSTLASTIPTIISDTARATDTRERRANTIFEKFQARIPGIREGLQPQVNVLGQEKGTTGNPLEIMADPTRPSPTQDTPVIQEIRRLWDAGQKVSPSLLGDKSGYSVLTPQENTNLWKRAGEITNAKLNSLFKLEQYKSLSDEEKGKVVDNIVGKSQIAARVGMVIKLTEGLTGDALKTKLSELKRSGLMTKEVYSQFLELR